MRVEESCGSDEGPLWGPARRRGHVGCRDTRRPPESADGCADKKAKEDCGSLTGQRALDAVEVGEAVGSQGPRGRRRHGPQVGLQSVQGRQAAVVLNTNAALASHLHQLPCLLQAPPPLDSPPILSHLLRLNRMHLANQDALSFPQCISH